MKVFVFALLVAVVYAHHEDWECGVCVPGKRVRVGCNECPCNSDGKYNACSLAACPDQKPCKLNEDWYETIDNVRFHCRCDNCSGAPSATCMEP